MTDKFSKKDEKVFKLINLRITSFISGLFCVAGVYALGYHLLVNMPKYQANFLNIMGGLFLILTILVLITLTICLLFFPLGFGKSFWSVE